MTFARAVMARARRVSLACWLVVALQVLLMLCVTILYPPFQNPDESAHVDYVLAHREGQWFDGPGQRHYDPGVLAAASEVPGIQGGTHIGGDAVPARSRRQSFATLDHSGISSPLPDQMVQHPPLYYALAAAWTYALPDFTHQRFDLDVFWLRLLSILLLAPVPLVIDSAGRRAGLRRAVRLAAMVAPLAIPSYLRTGASVNNDALLVLLGSLLAALLVRVAWGDRSRRVALGVGVVWGGMLLTKGFALAMPPAIAVAFLAGADGSAGQRLRRSWRPMSIALGVGCVIGLWWWVRNVMVYGAVQPDGYGQLSSAVRQQFFGAGLTHRTEFDFAERFARLVEFRWFGSLGLIDVPSVSHPVVYGLSFGATLLLVFVAVGAWLPRIRATFESAGDTRDWSAGRVATLWLPAVLTLVVMYVGARSSYFSFGQLSGIQVRYVMPGVVGLAVMASVGLAALLRGRVRLLPAAVLVATLAWLGLSTADLLRIAYAPSNGDAADQMARAIKFLVAWWPFPAVMSGAVAVLTVAAVLALLVVLMRLPGSRAGVTDGDGSASAHSFGR